MNYDSAAPYQSPVQRRTMPATDGYDESSASGRFSKEIQFVPGPFRYNLRFLSVALLSLPPLLALSSTLTHTIAVAGFMLSYILDFVAVQHWTLITFWLTLGGIWFSIFIPSMSSFMNSAFHIFTVMGTSFFLVFVGAWCTLQFRWFQRTNPMLSVMFERAIFACVPVSSLPLVLTTLGSLSASSSTPIPLPFLISFAACGMLFVFGRPVRSSFKVSNEQDQERIERDERIQGTGECVFLLWCACVLPCLAYITSTWRVGFSFFSAQHLLSLGALLCGPLLFVLYDFKKLLWWLNFNFEETGTPQSVMRIARHVCVIVLLAWFQVRIVFGSYGHLLSIRAPLSYIVVSFVSITAYLAYCFAAPLSQVANIPKSAQKVCQISMASCASTLCITLGFPALLAPLASAAAFCITAFFFTRSWKHYLVFGACSTIFVSWWCLGSLWPLGVQLTSSLDTRLLAILVPTLYALSVACGPFLLSKKLHRHAFGAEDEDTIRLPSSLRSLPIIASCLRVTSPAAVPLLAYNFLFTWVEMALVSNTSLDGLYPLPFAIGTSALACYASYTLYATDKLLQLPSALLIASHVSKFAFVAFATNSTFSLLLIYFAALLCSLSFAHLFLTVVAAKRGVSNAEALSHFIACCVSAFFLRGPTAALIAPASGASASLRFGVFLLLWGLSTFPIALWHMSHLASFKKFSFAVLASGGLLTVLCAASSQISPSHSFSSAYARTLFSTQPQFSTGWTMWLLVGLFLVMMGSITGLIPLPQDTFLYCIFAALSGGVFFLSFLPPGSHMAKSWWGWLLVPIIAGASALPAAALSLSAKNDAKASAASTYSFGGFISLLPIVLVLSKAALKSHPAFIRHDLERSVYTIVLALYLFLSLLAAIVIKFKLIGRPLLSPVTREAPRAGSFDLFTSLSAPLSQKDDRVVGASQLGITCNAATVSSYLILLSILFMTGEPSHTDTQAAIALSSSVLLLLHTDSKLLKNFTQHSPYFFVSLALFASLALAPLFDTSALSQPSSFGGNKGGVFSSLSSTMFLVKNILAFLFVCPSHFMFMSVLWKPRKPNTLASLGLIVLSVACWALSDWWNVQWLGATGAACSLLQIFTAMQMKQNAGSGAGAN